MKQKLHGSGLMYGGSNLFPPCCLGPVWIKFQV